MKLASDILEYKAASASLASLYVEIGTDDIKARSRREERQALNARKRETAENLLMSVLGEHGVALSRAGLKPMYEELAAGGGEISLLYKIADVTAESLA